MVRLECVTKYLDGRLVLRDIDLQIETGERLVLLGPSGCGKTTLLRLVAGLVSPDRGRIFIKGNLVSDSGKVIVPPEERLIGFVFQDLALWPHMSVYENLEFVLKALGLRRKERKVRIGEMVGMTDLEGMESRMPGELSGGQQQRVALARALVARPPLVLMDEPLSSLDWDLRGRLGEKICELQEEIGFTLIYVTHDRGETKQLATRVVVMKNGGLNSAMLDLK